jgi:hypothetical protein
MSILNLLLGILRSLCADNVYMFVYPSVRKLLLSPKASDRLMQIKQGKISTSLVRLLPFANINIDIYRKPACVRSQIVPSV